MELWKRQEAILMCHWDAPEGKIDKQSKALIERRQYRIDRDIVSELRYVILQLIE